MARHSVPNIIDEAVAATDRPDAARRSMMSSLVRSLRPSQWTKNLIIFAALIFARRLTDPSAVLLSIAAFAVFCALSGVVYLVNDIVDREADRQHPLKRNRPIASGALPVSVAATAATLLGGAALAAAFFLRFEFGVVAACYVALLALYSGPLKHVVIIDVLTIAIGFGTACGCRRRGDQCRNQQLAADRHDIARALPRTQQAAARARAARRRRNQPSSHPRGVPAPTSSIR